MRTVFLLVLIFMMAVPVPASAWANHYRAYAPRPPNYHGARRAYAPNRGYYYSPRREHYFYTPRPRLVLQPPWLPRRF